MGSFQNVVFMSKDDHNVTDDVSDLWNYLDLLWQFRKGKTLEGWTIGSRYMNKKYFFAIEDDCYAS